MGCGGRFRLNGRHGRNCFGHDHRHQGGCRLDVLLLDPAQASRRTRRARDRIEREGEDFHAALDGAYRQLAERFPDRIVSLDGSLPPKRLAERVRAALS